eukprot:6204223-Pleurochrysis_carterae.AAC.1
MEFIEDMAPEMDAAGKATYVNGKKGCVNWRVNVEDVLQRVGVGLYTLAFPIQGDRPVMGRSHQKAGARASS